MADLCGIQPKRLAALERGEVDPGPDLVARLIGLSHRLPSELLSSLSTSIVRSGLPRALSRSSRLRLEALSGPAIVKRPHIVDWIGKDLAPIACGELQAILEDSVLQRAIKKREVASIVTTTRSVLRTEDAETVGTYRTTINYFFHDGVLFSDAIAVPAPKDERMGYTPLLVDELGFDLFGDHPALEAGLSSGLSQGGRSRRG
jgi:hypothetical protein